MMVSEGYDNWGIGKLRRNTGKSREWVENEGVGEVWINKGRESEG